VTFEQWWGGLKNQPIPQLKPTFRECWNTALDAAEVTMARIERQVQEPQDPPVNDLATWVSFYRSRFKRALQLIRVRTIM
jgi:hypothetical protein